MALRWMCSFLTDRTQQVSYRGCLSSTQYVLFGAPQGSVLGPLLYVLYTAELEQIVARHDQRLHMYADDCQVYLSTSVKDVSLTVSNFAAYIADINAWLSAWRLRLNAAKTQLLWLGSSQLLDKVDCRDVLVCSALASPSLTPLVTSVLSSTVSCRWQPKSRPSVAPGTISCASSDQQSVRCP